MNYKTLKKYKNNIFKSLICLTAALVVYLGITKFLPIKNSIGALPSCVSYTGIKNPGVNCSYPSCASLSSDAIPGTNCLPSCADLTKATSTNGSASPFAGVNCYYLNLPLCTANSGSISITDSESIPKPRSNCADLIDMPLCSQISISGEARPLFNCVNECSQTSDIVDSSVGGHNVTCVRFCDRLPAGMTANPRSSNSAGNCIIRDCQKLDLGTLPTSANCNKLACNLLVVDELAQNKIQNEEDPNFGEYCDGSSVKCYNFTSAQLPYVRYRYNKTMCQIHNCKPATTSCGADVDGVDDTLNITNQGTNYTNLYINYINATLPISNNSICNPVNCKPVYYTQYLCSQDSDGKLTIPNGNCDSSGDGSSCSNVACDPDLSCKKDLGYCYKTVDCNLSANAKTTECKFSSSGETDSSTQTDDTESWFYRPSPLNKMYINDDPSQGYRISGFCYSKGDLENQTDSFGGIGCSNGSRWGCLVRYDVGIFTINLGYFHLLSGPGDRTRSPKMCGVTKLGFRGATYPYLCGNKGNLYKPVSQSTAYYQGYVDTNFISSSDEISKARVCVRFKNFLRPDDLTMSNSETCGSRECAVSCAFGICKTQYCGDEVCTNLSVQHSNSKECAMNNDMFLNSGDGKKCATVIDNFLRIRLIQYGNQICAFLDSKGQFAYNNMFFNGNEKLDNGTTCVSGTYNYTSGKCDGALNTNQDYNSAERWRTILKVRYTSGNTTRNGISGFYDKNGKFIKAQECIKVPLRVPPPDTYNLVTVNNVSKLFEPPLFLKNANNVRDGSRSADAGVSSFYGTTDFLFPEVVVQYGTTTKTLSLGAGYSGHEVNKDPLSYALDSGAMISTVNGATYSAGVLIKKEYDAYTGQPKVCLYRRVSNSSGFSDIKIACADRSFPEINNTGTPSANTIGIRKVQISGSTDNANILNSAGVYGDSSISLKYCYDDSCTNSNIITLTNTDPSTPTCMGANENNFEKYKICARREPCSKLWKECMENEINIQNSGLNSSNSSIRGECQTLVTTCNSKKGISTNLTGFLIDDINNSSADPKAYGWFNELCIISGFETKLGKVYQEITDSGVTGKCKLVADAPTSCTSGGNAAQGCNCLDASSGILINGYSIRNQTPREAGFCVDMPTPKICPAINYGSNNFSNSSLNGTSYTNSSPAGIVDVSHYNRKISNVNSSSGTGGGHGEYPTSVAGMNNVAGICNGFWQSTISSGNQVTPKMSCLDSSSGAVWSGLSTDVNSASCVRFSCQAITTNTSNNDSDSSGIYNDSFITASETSDSTNETSAAAGDVFGITYADVSLGSRGSSNGYAVWPKFTKSDNSDFLETVTATSCIAGYSSSSLPTRSCNQIGIWKNVNSSCSRIMCSAINPPYNPTSTSDWLQWSNSKGATFGVKVYLKEDSANGNYLGAPILTNGLPETHLTPASRSVSGVTVGSTRKGYCNNRLGFFQALGGNQPEADCLYNGTWSSVRNPCVTSCSAITNPGANDGNATWAAVNNVALGESVVVSGTCISGYVPYPYSRIRDDSGTVISPALTASDSAETLPHRTCQSVIVSGGNANVWTNTSSSCVNQCPGYDMDQREGVGKTTYSTSSYGTINIRWNSVSAGATDIQTIGYDSSGNIVGFDNKNIQTASDYSQALRSNGFFIVTRYCNSNYKWSDPVVNCPKNAGLVNYATIGTSLGSNPSDASILSSLTAANNTVTALSCSSGYGSSSMPVYKCQANSGNSNIDQYYYALSSGTACTQIICSLVNGQTYGSGSTYNGASTTIQSGSTVSLTCRSGYGHAFGAGSDTSCGRTSTDRITAAPTATCSNVNGVGVLSITNDCVSCRGCMNNDLTSYNIIGADVAVSNSMSCNTYSTTVSQLIQECRNNNITYNIAHNSSVSFGHFKSRKCLVSSRCRDRNVCTSANLQCIDGYFGYLSSDGQNLGSTGSCSSPRIQCGSSSQSCND